MPEKRRRRAYSAAPAAVKAGELCGDAIVSFVRSVVESDQKPSCSKLRDLSDKQLVELYRRFLDGADVQAMTDYVIEKWGAWEGRSRKLLVTVLRRFRDALPVSASKLSCSEDRTQLVQRIRKQHAALDAMEELRWVIKEQKTRIQSALSTERIGEKGNETRKEIRLFADMCKDYLEQELKLGVRERVPEKHLVAIDAQFHALRDRLEAGGAAVVDVISSVLSDVSQHVVMLEPGEDGVYHERPQTDAEHIRSFAFGQSGGIGSRARPEDESSGS